MRYRFYTADVFTDRIFGGNQLAVFPDARGLGAPQMQRVAREFNLSETVFVFPADDPAHTRRLRIFTPEIELPFAGHPTIGTAHVLAAIGEVDLQGGAVDVLFEEEVGPVRVSVRGADGRPASAMLTAAKRPELGPEPPAADALAAMLSLAPADLEAGDRPPQAVSCGVPFLLVPVRSRAALERVHLDVRRWEELLSDFWAPHVYCFTLDAGPGGADVRARMFAPAMGIREDPATGAAATALAGYLGVRAGRAEGTLRWVVAQGVEMGRPSTLQVEADVRAGTVVAARVGGGTVIVSEGLMEVPDEDAAPPQAA